MMESDSNSTPNRTSEEHRRLLLDLVNRHVKAEVEQDLAGVLATVCPEPYFEIHPLGYALTTHEAVEQFYRRMISMFRDLKPVGTSATFAGGATGKFIGDLGIVTRDNVLFRTESGVEKAVKSMAHFQLDESSGLLKGEEIFLNAAAADAFRRALGEDFKNLPGVVSTG
jgi:hypothetical protein